jgi:hypothetical protein
VLEIKKLFFSKKAGIFEKIKWNIFFYRRWKWKRKERKLVPFLRKLAASFPLFRPSGSSAGADQYSTWKSPWFHHSVQHSVAVGLAISLYNNPWRVSLSL